VSVRQAGWRWSGVLFIVVLLGLWEGASRAGWVYTVYMPPVTRIAAAWGELIASGELLLALGSSLYRMALGYAAAVALAVPLGVLIGFYRAAFNLFEPLTELLRPLPPPAVIPLAILFLGIGDAMKVFMIAFACFFPMLVSSTHAVRNVEPPLIDAARALGFGDSAILRYIVVPLAMPAVAAGMKISLAIALILTVIAEMVGGNDGLGFVILDAQRSFRVPEMYAGIFTLAILGYGLNRLFTRSERRLLAWHRRWYRTEGP
jgi:ABC-type nitrate/sulfonate/bicarbonate transport system permease component